MPKAKSNDLPDIQFGRDWGQHAGGRGRQMTELQRRMYCARWAVGDTPVFEHRKRIIKALWPEGVYSWHPWMDKRLLSVSQYNFVTWMAGGGCVHGDTKIENPVTGESKTIAALHEDGNPVWVMTLDGPRMAECPFIKGREHLCSVRTSDGNQITTTPGHRVLTPLGYRRVGDLRIGDTLLAWRRLPQRPDLSLAGRVLPATNLGIDPLTRAEDARGSRKKAANSPARYSAYSRPCDAQPHWEEGSGQSSFPSRDDAPEYMAYAFCDSGGSGSKFPDSHPGLSSSLPSIDDSSGQRCSSRSDAQSRVASNAPESRMSLSRLHDLSPKEKRLLQSFSESYRDSIHTGLSCSCEHREQMENSWGYSIQEVAVESITYTDPQVFYDITVPGAGHYFAEGTIHHNTGKSTDAAIIALQYWLEAPHDTAVICCSTTKDSLKTRIWSQIVHYHNLLPPEAVMHASGMIARGDLLDASCFIRYKDGDWKNGIKGVAVQDGPVEEAVNNIIGMHTGRVFWILDEMQGVREAVMKAIPNLLKNPESKMLGMGNPNSFTSMLCRYSEPVGGWQSIRKFQSHWETESHGYKGKGVCLFFDGRKSPAVLDPEWGKRNPWMTNQAHIDSHLRSREVNGNESHPDFMCQTIGWPPSQGIEQTVLDGAIVNTFKCQQKVVWTQGRTLCAALDPAFNGGDRAILQFGARGFVSDEDGARWVIQLGDWMDVPIDGESQRPIHYQIMDFCKAECARRGISAKEFAVAAAGEGGGLVSIMETEWGPVNAIEEGGKPSERIVNERGTSAKDEYDTRASELSFLVRDFAMSHGIRGLSNEAMEQFCARQTFYKNGKWCVEPKTGSKGRTDASTGKAAKGFKERMGYSPDHADSVQILVWHCQANGAQPSFAVVSPQRKDEWDARRVQVQDTYFTDENYTEQTDWREESAGYSMSAI